MPRKFVYNVLRPVAVMAMVIAVASSGWIATVDAAYESLPGDILYPAKRAAEKTQSAVAAVIGDKKAETKLHMEFAKRRAVEVKKIAVDPKKKSKITGAVADLKTEMQTVENKLEEIKTAQGKEVAAMAQDVGKNTIQITDALKDVKNTLLTSTTTEDMALSKEVSEAKDAVKDVSMKAVEVMVAKHLEGDKSVSSEEIKQAMVETLVTVAIAADQSSKNAQTANVAVEAAKTEMKGAVQGMTAAQTLVSASNTKMIAEQVNTAVAQTQEAVKKTGEVSVAVDKTIVEAKKLLVEGDLGQAMDKILQVNEATKVSEQISDSAIIKAQSVMPAAADVLKGAASASSSIGIVSSTPAIIKIEPVIITSTIKIEMLLATSTMKTAATAPKISTSTIK